MNIKVSEPHWYFVTSFYCPICAHTEIYRERRKGKRPKLYEDRHKIVESYDYCNAL